MSSKTTMKRRSSAVGDAPEAALGHGPLQLDRFIPYRLAVLAHRVSRAIALRYETEFDLTIPEWRVMALLAQAPGLTAREVAAATPMDKVAISRAVRRLEHNGRLKARMDSEDGRRQRLELTAKGLQVYARVAPRARELEGRLLAELSAQERETLARLLDKLDRQAAALAENG